MIKTILFSSFFFSVSCATSKSPDLLASHADDNFPENQHISPKRIHVYLFSHTNELGDQIPSVWIKIEDPR